MSIGSQAGTKTIAELSKHLDTLVERLEKLENRLGRREFSVPPYAEFGEDGMLWADRAQFLARFLRDVATRLIPNARNLVLQGKITGDQAKAFHDFQVLATAFSADLTPCMELKKIFDDLVESFGGIEPMVRATYHGKGADWGEAPKSSLNVVVPMIGSGYVHLSKDVECDDSFLRFPAHTQSQNGTETQSQESCFTVGQYVKEIQDLSNPPQIDQDRVTSTLEALYKKIEHSTTEPSTVSSPSWQNRRRATTSPWRKCGWDGGSNRHEAMSLFFTVSKGPTISVSVKPTGVVIHGSEDYLLDVTENSALDSELLNNPEFGIEGLKTVVKSVLTSFKSLGEETTTDG